MARAIDVLAPVCSPFIERPESEKQLLAFRGEGIFLGRVTLEDARGDEFAEALAEDRGGHAVAAGLEFAEAERAFAQFPEDAEGPAAAKEIERGHDGPAGGGAADGAAGERGPLCVVVHCYGNRSRIRWCYEIRSRSLCMPPFISPIAPPYSVEVEAELSRLMGGSSREPLLLFRTMANHLAMTHAWGSLGNYNLGRGALPVRDRELLILRTCYLNRCEYEWGVHVRIYARAAGLSKEEWAATASPSGACETWSARDRDVLSFAESLHSCARVSNEIRASLRRYWDDAQFLEAAEVAGFYHGVSFIANIAEVEREDWAERFPR